MRNTALLIAALMGFTTSAFAGPPPKKSSVIKIGKTASIRLDKNSTTFTISVKDGGKLAESKTVGDPMVFWRGKWAYWPAPKVVYVLPDGVKIYGSATNKQGYCDELVITKGAKILKVVSYNWAICRTQMRNVSHKVFDETATTLYKGKQIASLKYHRTIFKTAPRIVFVGGKVGWHFYKKGKRLKVRWRK